MNNSASITSDDNDVLKDIYAANICLAISGGIGAITNLIVVIVISMSKSLHLKCYVFIGNLAMVDSLLGGAYCFTAAKRIYLTAKDLSSKSPQINCLGEVFFLVIGTDGSQVFTCLVAIDRLLAVVLPVWYYKCSINIAFGQVTLAWLFLFTNACFVFYDINDSKLVPLCGITATVTDTYYLWSTVESLFFIILTILFYLAILTIMKYKMLQTDSSNPGLQSTSMQNSVESKVTKSLLIILLIFSTTSVASRIAFAVLNLWSAEDRSRITPYFRNLQTFASAVSLFIYMWKDTRFYNAIKAAFGRSNIVTGLSGVAASKNRWATTIRKPTSPTSAVGMNNEMNHARNVNMGS